MTKTIRPDVGLCSANPNDLQIKADLISETSGLAFDWFWLYYFTKPSDTDFRWELQ